MKQRLPVMAARVTGTPVGGVVGLYDKLTPMCILFHRTYSRGPPVRRAWLASALPVGDSDMCKVEPWSGTSVGAMVRTQSSIVSLVGDASNAFADRPAGWDHRPGRPGRSHGPRRWAFIPGAVLG
jgi:hypothetical protein